MNFLFAKPYIAYRQLRAILQWAGAYFTRDDEDIRAWCPRWFAGAHGAAATTAADFPRLTLGYPEATERADIFATLHVQGRGTPID